MNIYELRQLVALIRKVGAQLPLVSAGRNRAHVVQANIRGHFRRRSHTEISTSTPKQFQLVAFTRAKNEGRYLAEWICFHLAVGFEHFYIYDNNSDDNTASVLKPFVDHGLVTHIHWPQSPPSPSADWHCVNNFGPLTEWMASIDIDEFLFPIEAIGVPEILSDFHHYSALGVHWRVFGSSGYEYPPDGLVIESYLRCASAPDPLIKSIFKPSHVLEWRNNHHWIYRGWQQAVNEHKKPLYGTLGTQPTADRIQCNHYYCKSAADYRRKCGPQWASTARGARYKTHLEERLSYELSKNNDSTDKSILRFTSKTKALMALYGAC